MQRILIMYKIIYPTEDTTKKYTYDFIIEISSGLTLQKFLKYYQKLLIQEIEKCKYADDSDEVLECFQNSEIELSGEKLAKEKYDLILKNRNVLKFKINMCKSTKNIKKLQNEKKRYQRERYCCVVM